MHIHHGHEKTVFIILLCFGSFFSPSPLLRANCLTSLYVFSSSAGHLETHREMELIFRLMKSMLHGSRKKTYLKGREILRTFGSWDVRWLFYTTFSETQHRFLASWDLFSPGEINKRWWHLLLCYTDPSLSLARLYSKPPRAIGPSMKHDPLF